MRLTINRQEATVSAAADLHPYWQAVRGRQFSEVWLAAGEDRPALALLVNGAHAWLMYLRNQEGDPGLSSRNPDYAGPTDARMEFILDNGQLDKYPIAWTLPLEQGDAAYYQHTMAGAHVEQCLLEIHTIKMKGETSRANRGVPTRRCELGA